MNSEQMLPLDSDLEVADAAEMPPRPLHLRWPYIALVAAGGMAGTGFREAMVLLIPPIGVFPVAVFAINMVGAFFLGALLESLARRGPDEGQRRVLRLLLGTGFAGGFTTYSSFAVEAAVLLSTGSVGIAVGYSVGTVLLGAGATFVGISVAATVHRQANRSRKVEVR